MRRVTKPTAGTFLAIAIILSATVPSRANEGVAVSTQGDLAIALPVASALGTLSAAVTACLADKTDDEAVKRCVCANNDKLEALKASIGAAISDRPEWSDKTLHISDASTDTHVSLSIPNIRAQFEAFPCH